jgi:hypothetical protein
MGQLPIKQTLVTLFDCDWGYQSSWFWNVRRGVIGEDVSPLVRNWGPFFDNLQAIETQLIAHPGLGIRLLLVCRGLQRRGRDWRWKSLYVIAI